MNTAAGKRYFTVADANRRLPLIRAIVRDIVELACDLRDRRERLDRILHRPGVGVRSNDAYSEELQHVQDELEEDGRRLEELADELHQLGVELKDPFIGLVDFPTLIGGREAYLCWKLGEEEVGFWHDLDAGYRGRQPLLESTPVGPSDADHELAEPE